MKNTIIHKSILIFVFALALSNIAYASEVTGNLSSSGSQAVGKIATESISGTVTSEARSSGSSGGERQPTSTGQVLGVATSEFITPDENYLSSDGKAILPKSNLVAFDSGTDLSVFETNTIEAASTGVVADNSQQAEVLGASLGMSTSFWFWIILGILAVVILLLMYQYSRYDNKKIIKLK